MVRSAAAKLAAREARQVLQMVDAVALGTGSHKPADARRIREHYLQALEAALPSNRPARDPGPEPDAAERELLGLDLIDEMRARGELV